MEAEAAVSIAIEWMVVLPMTRLFQLAELALMAFITQAWWNTTMAVLKQD